MIDTIDALLKNIDFYGRLCQASLIPALLFWNSPVVTVLLSWVCGLFAALGKSSNYKVLKYPCSFYIWIIRGTPTLIQIYIVYFGLPQIGFKYLRSWEES